MAFVAMVQPDRAKKYEQLYDALVTTQVTTADVPGYVALGWTELAAADVTLVQATPDPRLLTLDAGAVRVLTPAEETAAGIDLLHEHKLGKVMEIDKRTVELLDMAGMPAQCLALRAAEDVAAAGGVVAGGKALIDQVVAATTIAAVDAVQDNR